MGEAGFLKILPGQFARRTFLSSAGNGCPARESPKPPIFALAPDLAVEILSKGNTKREMKRKLRDYFKAGVRLVWYIEPKTRTARAYTAEQEWTEIGPDGSLLGGEVLPGFESAACPVVRPRRRAAKRMRPRGALKPNAQARNPRHTANGFK